MSGDVVERSPEMERMETTLANISPLKIFSNARSVAKREYQKQANWVFAMRLFGLGSTYAFEQCRRMGIDPDGHTTTLTNGGENGR